MRVIRVKLSSPKWEGDFTGRWERHWCLSLPHTTQAWLCCLFQLFFSQLSGCLVKSCCMSTSAGLHAWGLMGETRHVQSECRERFESK